MMDDYMMVSSYIATALLLVVLPIYLLLLFLGAGFDARRNYICIKP